MLNAFYAHLVKDMTAEQREKLDAQLFPVEVDPDTWGLGAQAQAEQSRALASMGPAMPGPGG